MTKFSHHAENNNLHATRQITSPSAFQMSFNTKSLQKSLAQLAPPNPPEYIE